MDPDAALSAPESYTIADQDVELDFDFATRTLIGRTAIKFEPKTKDLKSIHLRCRQMDIKSVKIDNTVISNFKYRDPYKKMKAREGFTVHQHHLINCGLERKGSGKDDMELTIPLPSRMKLQAGPSLSLSIRADSKAVFHNTEPSTPLHDGSAYRTFTIYIEYVMRNARDGIHWVGLQDGDLRYPQVYTYSNSLAHTPASYVFPCVDLPGVRHPWRFTITCPRTLGDIVPKRSTEEHSDGQSSELVPQTNGTSHGTSSHEVAGSLDPERFLKSCSDVDRSLELSVVCSGDMEDSDAPIDERTTKRRWVFTCKSAVIPRHVGFAIGPFEMVDLTKYRESDQDDKLGQSAYNVHGFCLPGRAEELKNVCIPIASALDKMSTMTVFYPFETSYKVCFVDDLPFDVVDTASLSIISSRLLVPQEILDPLYETTREIIHAVFSQWIGVKLVAKNPQDSWIIVGGSYFMADLFMQTLWGRNEQRFRLKLASDKIHELDVKRPSIYDLGAELGVDSSEYDFLKLKAPTVLTILHNRIIKANGRNGIDRMFWRALLDDQTGKIEDGELDTERFMRIAEKVAHSKFDPFFYQWVFGAGCPTFRVSQRFNKKKLVVEIFLNQVMQEDLLNFDVSSESFMRDIKEQEEGFPSVSPQRLFTGPMTIRIHEADGTPYEHIVDIKEITTKVEIPYNTKYKRLKRNKRQKERAAAAAGVNVTEDAQDDVLLYCLGDVLQTEEEMKEWELVDWSKEDENRMGDEHYEWIRLDKDFEWITKIAFSQPHYMFVSQLQQDNDVVAQVESVQYLLKQQPFPIVSTILIRTLMDKRYFYGIRVMAAHALARCAISSLNWVGLTHLEKAFQEFYCFENSVMMRSNDFSDLRRYRVQCAIPEAIAMVRDSAGKCPDRVKKFFIDKLKFNDNSNNEFSDSFYVATLLSCLAKSMISTSDSKLSFDFGDHDQEVRDADFTRTAVDEIQRFRRIDEWIPSFHNLYTVTALDSMKLFMQKGIAPRRVADFLQFTRPDNSDTVRIKAFECLVDLGVFQSPNIMTYFIVSFYSETSPYLRSKLWNVISQAFGLMALAIPEVKALPEPVSGLVIDDAAIAAESRQAAVARTQTLAGAIANLQSQVKDQTSLQDVLLEAMQSPIIGAENFLDVLTLCRTLYEPVDSFKITLKLPQYWTAKHMGEGVVRFRRTGRYRQKPFTRLEDRLPRAAVKANAKRALPLDTASALQSSLPSEPSIKRQKTSPLDDIPLAQLAKPAPPVIPSPAVNVKAAAPKIRLPSFNKPSTIDSPSTKSTKKSLIVKVRLSSEFLRQFTPGTTAASGVPGGKAKTPKGISPPPGSVSSMSPPPRPVAPPTAAEEPKASKVKIKLKLSNKGG
jgi:transcription initiation factor TFIID subunit 2